MFIFIVLQFFKLLNLYEDYLEQLLFATMRFGLIEKFLKKREIKKRETQTSVEEETNGSTIDRSQIGFHLVLFLVWCAAAVPAIPSVLEWAKNYRYEFVNIKFRLYIIQLHHTGIQYSGIFIFTSISTNHDLLNLNTLLTL